ncbi:MAG: DUF5009 domain-containing protein [Planctomycetota bacterium]
MRGATILGMLLVNNPGSWSDIYAPLRHAVWHGWTPTDLVFPFFIFMVGVAMAFSLGALADRPGGANAALWLRISRRVLVLILLGLVLNASGRLLSVPFGLRDSWDFDTLRWPGVLQRIALAYLGAALIVLLVPGRWRMATGVGILLAYTAAIKLLPANVEPELRMEAPSNVVLAVDRVLLGENHLWTGAVTDPEGLLSTLPAIVTALIGYAVGLTLRGRDELSGEFIGRLAATGVGMSVVGQLWDWLAHPGLGMPINKALWTPSFVLLTAGLALLLLSGCLLLLDSSRGRSPRAEKIASAFQLVGVNAIFVFVASGLFARALSLYKVGEQSLKGWVYQNGFITPLEAVGLTDPKLSSLAFALAFVGFWWLVLWMMWIRGWSIRV